MNKEVDKYVKTLKLWQTETIALREILLECDLEEALKWGKPAYLNDGRIIVVIQAFKAYFALLFYKGNLLSDSKNILQKTGPNTKVGRQLRFESVSEIKKLKPAIKSYIKEAIAVNKR